MFKHILSLAIVGLTLSLSANAAIVSNGTVNELSTFRAESDNSIWLRLDALESTNPNGVYSVFLDEIAVAGFSIATGNQVVNMLSNDGVGNPYQSWSTITSVIGIAANRSDFTGGYVLGQHWVSAYDTYGSWANNPNYSSSSNSNFGVWATYTGVSQVPIPAAAWLFGSALVGLVGIKRKK